MTQDSPETAADAALRRLLLQRDVEAFLVREVALLDAADLDGWRDLFTDGGYYWAPARPDQESPLDEISLFYDDRAIMAMRAARLREAAARGGGVLARTRHLVGNVVLGAEAGPSLAVGAAFVLVEYRPEMEPRTFAGEYAYELVREGSGFRIAVKKALLINCDAAFYPLSLPF